MINAQMTQKLFDAIVAHLRLQGATSQRDDMPAAYYGRDGFRCAIGAIIPNAFYNPAMEGHVVMHSRVLGILTTLYPGVPEGFYVRMQRIHDAYSVKRWEKEFIQAANDFRLTYTPPTGAEQCLMNLQIPQEQSSSLLECAMVSWLW